jgi:hypothetical protein
MEAVGIAAGVLSLVDYSSRVTRELLTNSVNVDKSQVLNVQIHAALLKNIAERLIASKGLNDDTTSLMIRVIYPRSLYY